MYEIRFHDEEYQEAGPAMREKIRREKIQPLLDKYSGIRLKGWMYQGNAFVYAYNNIEAKDLAFASIHLHEETPADQ